MSPKLGCKRRPDPPCICFLFAPWHIIPHKVIEPSNALIQNLEFPTRPRQGFEAAKSLEKLKTSVVSGIIKGEGRCCHDGKGEDKPELVVFTVSVPIGLPDPSAVIIQPKTHHELNPQRQTLLGCELSVSCRASHHSHCTYMREGHPAMVYL